MEFLDSNHRVFSLRSYEDNPIGYEYNEQPYVFWVNKDDRSFLSVNNYYMHTIYCLVDLSLHGADRIPAENLYEYIHITVNIDSGVYSLINAQIINNAINNITNIDSSINFDMFLHTDDDTISWCCKELSSDHNVNGMEDIVGVKIKENDIEYLLVPIYVLCKAEESGAWLTNILITVTSDYLKEYCPITIGGEFNEMYENLVIHGENMGVKLPKDILRAIYNNSYYDTEFDEGLYNEKLKEYLLNFYNIKANQGNNQSLLNSLKWFGWGDNLSIKSLFNMSNEYINQFLIKGFDLYDMNFLYTYNKFLRSSLIKLYVKMNTEKKDSDGNVIYNEQNYNDTGFIGEGNPVMIDLNETYKFVENYDYYNDDYYIDEDTNEYKPFVENIPYVKSFYNFTLNELSLKLVLLKYYLNKYFLPIHVSVHSSTLQHKVYANDIKMKNEPAIHINGGVLSNEDATINVKFGGTGHYFFHKQLRIIDQYFNEFDIASYYNEEDGLYHFPASKDLFYLYDTCVSIPITFVTDTYNNTQYYDCSLFIEKETENVDKYKYKNVIKENNSFLLTDDIFIYNNDDDILYYNEKLNDGNFAYSYNINDSTEFKIFYNSLDSIKERILKSSNLHSLESIEIPYEWASFEVIENNPAGFAAAVSSMNHYTGNNIMIWFINNLVSDGITTNFENTGLFVRYIDNNENNIYKYKVIKINNSVASATINENISLNINNLITNETSQMISFSICSTYSLQLKSNLKNISVYKINWDDINEILSNKQMLIDLNIYNQSYQNKIKVIFKHLYYKNKINELTTSYIDINNTDIVYESHFQFIQNNDNIYKNFILCPKFLTRKDITYYQNGTFILKLLCNNKWYYHKFTTDMSDLIIDLGKLEYQYYDSNNVTSQFNQLSLLDVDSKEIAFNVYMHNNDLVKTYNSMYPVDIYKRYCEENRIYMGIEDIPEDYLLYYITVCDIRIYLSLDLYNSNKDIYIPFIWNDNSPGHPMSIDNIKPADKFNSVILDYHNKCIVSVDTNYTFRLNNENLNQTIDEYGNFKYIRLYRKENKFSLTSTQDPVFAIHEILNKIDLFKKYKATFNIPYLTKYHNEVVLFDLKKQVKETIDILEYYHNIHMSLNGIMFNTDIADKKKIIISGKLFVEQDRYIYDNYTDSGADIYSVMSNIDLNISEASEADINDSLQLKNIKRDDVYVYYVDNKMNYTTTPYSEITEYMGYMVISSSDELTNLIGQLGETVITVIDNDGNEVEYSIINKNANSNDALYVITNGVNEYKMNINIEPLVEENKLKASLSYIYISHNFPKYVYGKSNIQYIDEHGSIFINVDDTYVEVLPIDYIEYVDARNDKPIKDSPSMMWFNIDLSDNINKLSFELDKQNLIDYTNNALSVNAMTYEEFNSSSLDDDHEISYFNYLEYDLSHLRGSFTFMCKYSSSLVSNNIPIITPVIEIDGSVYEDITLEYLQDSDEYLYKMADEVSVSSDTISAKLYFRMAIDEVANIDFDDDTYYMIPYLYKTSIKYEDVLYDENYEIPLNYDINILDTESLSYPDGVNDNIVDLYSHFFENRQVYTDKDNTEYITFVEPQEWCTFVNVSIDYDLYLMHDKYKWFCIYISKNTINHYRKYRNLNITHPDDMISEDGYKLEFVKSSKNFLINRYKYVSAEGNNVFNKDDIVCGLVLNNDRLPTNFDQGCKWNIARQSLEHDSSKFTINQNMGILSFLNDNEYKPGYYDVSVRYTLDNNSTQQRIKKMVMKIQ